MTGPLKPDGESDPLANNGASSGFGVAFASESVGIKLAAVVLAFVGVVNVLTGLLFGTVLALVSIALGVAIAYVALGYWRRRWWAYWCGGGTYLLLVVLGASVGNVVMLFLGAPGFLYTVYRRDAFRELA